VREGKLDEFELCFVEVLEHAVGGYEACRGLLNVLLGFFRGSLLCIHELE
jgi:hypothetical protein